MSVLRLSRAAYRKSVENLWWAAGYNVVAIPLAAGAFAWAGISMPPALAAILMSASTIVVALNAQLLRRLDLRPAPIEEGERGRAHDPGPGLIVAPLPRSGRGLSGSPRRAAAVAGRPRRGGERSPTRWRR